MGGVGVGADEGVDVFLVDGVRAFAGGGWRVGDCEFLDGLGGGAAGRVGGGGVVG